MLWKKFEPGPADVDIQNFRKERQEALRYRVKTRSELWQFYEKANIDNEMRHWIVRTIPWRLDREGMRKAHPKILSMILHVWKGQMHLDKASKKLAKVTQQERKLVKEHIQTDLCRCYRRRQLREAWQHARRCTGTKRGNKRRWGNCPITSNPSLQQLMDKLKKHSSLGGWSAEVVSQREGTKLEDVKSHMQDVLQEYER